MKLSPRDQVLVAIVIVVAVAAAAVFLLVVPRFQKAGELDTQIVGARAEADEAQVLLERRVAAKTAAAFTSAKLMSLSNRMPDAPEVPALIIELQDTANEAGLEFVQIAPRDPVVQAGYTAYPIDMLVRGKWQDYVDFLQRLKKLNRGLRIRSWSVSPIMPDLENEVTTDDEFAVSVTTQIEVYTLAPPPPPVEATVTPTPAPAP